MYNYLVQVCQVMNPNANAGTDDTTFSVNSEGNVVIAYGGYKKEGYTRYCSDLRRLERVFSCVRARNPLMPQLRFTCQWKCHVKSHKPEIKAAGNINFVFISKFCSVTYLDFMHACNIQYATSNRIIWEKVIQ